MKGKMKLSAQEALAMVTIAVPYYKWITGVFAERTGLFPKT